MSQRAVPGALGRWLPERQIILRQNDQIRAFRVSSAAQLMAVGAVAMAAIWTLAATGAYLNVRTTATPTIVARQSDEAPAPATPAAPAEAALRDDDVATNRTAEASAAQSKASELDRALSATRQQLQEAEAARLSAIAARDGMAARLSDSEERMRTIDGEHAAALKRLTQETRKSITEVERIINATGIDPARLVPQSTPDGHRGGPFVPWRGAHDAGRQPPHAAAPVNPDIERLDALAQILREMPLAAPVEDFAITSPFGRRIDPFNGAQALHEGIDLQAPLRTPVAATAPGRVVFAGRRGAYGLMVEIEHGHDIRTRYAHLDRIAVALGQRVTLHQKIGLLGATGRASGPHVHYEILVDGQPHDPLNFLKAASHVRKIQ